MYITDNVAAEGFRCGTQTEQAEAAAKRLTKTLSKRQRVLFLRFYDEMNALLNLTAQDNYVRGLCMGLSFAERYCYLPK
ncbi:MAG: hypothetical protein Q4C72_08375 [Eubacteriales bacterium]|nr:hypothetical protein [Eubacteriales bacterium]